MERITFTRKHGCIELTKDNVSAAAQYARATDGLLTKLPGDLIDAAALELVRLAKERVERSPSVTFDQAMTTTNPDLLMLSLCRTADNDAQSHVFVERER